MTPTRLNARRRGIGTRPSLDLAGRLAIGVEEAAQALGVCRSTAWSLVRAGAIPSFYIGHRRLVRVAALEAFISAQQKTAPDGDTSRTAR